MHDGHMLTSATHEQRPVPRFRAVREARGLSLRETARRSRMDPAHLSRVERGAAGLSIDSLRRLAQVLGLEELAKATAASLDQEHP